MTFFVKQTEIEIIIVNSLYHFSFFYSILIPCVGFDVLHKLYTYIFKNYKQTLLTFMQYRIIAKF